MAEEEVEEEPQGGKTEEESLAKLRLFIKHRKISFSGVGHFVLQKLIQAPMKGLQVSTMDRGPRTT